MTDTESTVRNTADAVQAKELADGLRRVADMIENRPDVYRTFRYAFLRINVFPDDPAGLRSLIRIALDHGAAVEKDVLGKYFEARMRFGEQVSIAANVLREEVCERVVVGTEQVTEQVPDPTLLAAVPMVAVTRQVERVEWVCRPLMAADAAPAVEAVSA